MTGFCLRNGSLDERCGGEKRSSGAILFREVSGICIPALVVLESIMIPKKCLWEAAGALQFCLPCAWRLREGALYRVFGILSALLCFTTIQAGAATRFVNNLGDSGAGSLRATIAAAASGDTISFTTSGTITLTSGELTINKNLTISGPGPDALTVTSIGRAFQVTAGSVSMSGLAIRNCVQANGSALLVQAGANVSLFNCIVSGNQAYWENDFPGCVVNRGTLTLVNSTLTQNQGYSANTVYSAEGSTLTVNNCLFEANGNLAIRAFGTLTLNNTTIYKNGGGAVSVLGTATITSCTIYRNNHPGGGGINVWGTLRIRNTITANNTSYQGSGNVKPYAFGAVIISDGYNLSSDDANGLLTGTGDQINKDPGLDPYGVQYHGGYNGTIALTAGSPAIDGGKSFGLAGDQRGYARTIDNPAVAPAPGGDSTDIGAYESPADPLQAGEDIVVNTLDDHDDGVASGGDCTLREAIRRANGAAGNFVVDITFAPGLAGTIALNRSLGELVINAAQRIRGPGARLLTVSGGGYIRVFNVVNVSGGVYISGLNLREGWQAFGNAGASNQGGAIRNVGQLNLDDCSFLRNYAAGQSAAFGSSIAGGDGQGGAIYNGGYLRMNRCLFARDTSGGNLAAGGAGASSSGDFSIGRRGGAGQGGAIFNAAGATLEANNCTFTGNSAAGGGGGSGAFGGNGGPGSGGAIFNLGKMTLLGCTIAGNAGTGGAGGSGNNPFNNGVYGPGTGGLASQPGSSSIVGSSICATNIATGYSRAHDVEGAFASIGYNLIGTSDRSTGFSHSADQSGTDNARLDPRLGPLHNNGGPIDTLSPLAGSPAVDRGSRFALTSDARGMPRPIDDPALPNAAAGDGSDIGAVEVVPEGQQTAARLVVTTLTDTDDGQCTYLHCTLREAINAANAMPGSNTITFAPTVTGAILLTSPLSGVTSNLEVEGPGARQLAIDGNNAHRVFSFLGGESTLSGLTIRNGYLFGSPGQSVGGAGINNRAALRVVNCTLADNRAGSLPSSSGSGGSANGGAVYNSGSLTLQGCTLRGNSGAGGAAGPSSSRPGSGGSGVGAIYNDIGGLLALNHCTLYQNTGTGGVGGRTAENGGDGGAGFGGVFNRGGLSVTSCTFSLNSGKGGLEGRGGTFPGTMGAAAGALAHGTGTNLVRNSILWGNLANSMFAGPDIYGSFTSGGYNLLGTTQGGSGFTTLGDQLGSDPNLGPLRSNGGPTDTMAVFLDSAALDKGNSFGLQWDQRGMPRHADSPASANASGGDGTDIGAFEFSPTSLWDMNGDAKDDPDSDSDGMPDYFEIFYGFNLLDPNDADHDFDGDGMTNSDEFWHGTDPKDPDSVLRITAIWRQGNNIELTFSPVLADRSYELMAKDALGPGQWGLINGVAPVRPSSAGTGRFTDPTTSASPLRFYRIRLW